MLGLKGDIASRVLGLADDLHLDAFRTDIIEEELGTRGTLGVDSTGDTDGDIGLLLALGETLVGLEEFAQVIGDLELVRVGVGLLGLAQLVDSLAADLEVLLYSSKYFSNESRQLQVTA
jgi:hypothetical protein